MSVGATIAGGSAGSTAVLALVALLAAGCGRFGGGGKGSRIPTGVGCEVDSIRVFHQGNRSSAPSGGWFSGVSIDGGAELSDLGAYNDPQSNGEVKHVIWVEVQGGNLSDCRPWRFWDFTTTYPNGSEDRVDGYTTSGLQPSGANEDWDTQNPERELDRLTRSDTIMIGDAPGVVPNWTDDLGGYPASIDNNFVVRVYSTTCADTSDIAASSNDACIAAEATYDLRMEMTGAGPSGVDTNSVDVGSEETF